MLLFAEFMVNLFVVLAVVLGGLALFWVMPTMVLMVRDEIMVSHGGKTGRHRLGLPGTNDIAAILVMEHPGGSLGTHHKSFHGRSFLQHG